jgi:hypothetical protein
MGNLHSQRRRSSKRPKIPIKSYEPNPVSLCPTKIGTFHTERVCDSCMENPVQTRLNCGHDSLCYHCIYTWTQVYKKNTCPICRTVIKTIQVPYILEYIISDTSIIL